MGMTVSSTIERVQQSNAGVVTNLQNNAAATGNGTLANPKGSRLLLVTRGTFVATIKVEVSIDGTNFVQHGADITAPGTLALDIPTPPAAGGIRARISAYTSGNVFADLVE